MIIIYRGDDPTELVKIEQAMNMKGICYNKTLYYGLVGPLNVNKLVKLLTKRTDNPYLQRLYPPAEVFEIQVNLENELLGKEIIKELNLSQPVISIRPSVFSSIRLIIAALLFLFLLAFFIMILPRSTRMFF